MKKQMNSGANESARAGYDAPRAQRLNDAATATGNQCAANGDSAGNTCVNNGSNAVACLNYGNNAYNGCVDTGNTAHECGAGNYAA
jgi:hypothetical protein